MTSPTLSITFTAHATAGSGRGVLLGYPTINLRIEDVPSNIEEGIYAGYVDVVRYASRVGKQEQAKRITSNEQRATFSAAIHYGPRLLYNDSTAFEIHLIDAELEAAPDTITVEMVARLRDVENFPSENALKEQIAMDISEARAILQER